MWFWNNMWQHSFQQVYKHIGNDFKNNIIKIDRPKLFNPLWDLLFLDLM